MITMFTQIIPTKKLPRGLSELTYRLPADLQKSANIGTLATIPLRDSTTTGIITEFKKNVHLPYSIKSILDIPHCQPIFTPQQLKLFKALAKYYRVSASLFIHSNLPKLIKKDWSKIYPIADKQLTKKFPPKSKYFWWKNINQRNKFYKRLITAALNNKFQLLIIVPRINDINQLQKTLKLSHKNFIPIYHRLSRSQNVKIWQTCLSAKPKIFIGTRSSLFYPYTRLSTIIVDDESSLDHKQYDMNPRYEVRIVANLINKIYKSKIIYSSPAPSLTTYHQFKPKPFLPSSNLKPSPPLIINLKYELAKKNFSFLSDDLCTQIKNTLSAKKSIFLFVNRKGESSTVTCRDCGYIFKCPTCSLPLIKTSDQKLNCFHCNYYELMPPFCPSCSGPNFKQTGLGIQKIKNNLQKIFPSQKITLFAKTQKKITNHKSSILNPQSSILIGTEFALDKIDWKKISLLGIINADQLWHHSEFNSSEKAYHLLVKLLTLPPKNAIISIQTFSPEAKIIQALVKNKPEIFYKYELNFRKNFNYPPFTNLVKLSISNKSEKKASYMAEKIYTKLKKSAPNTIEISTPLPILRKKIRGKFKYNIILKLTELNDLDKIIKLIPNDWLIDIHPKNLFA